jgi:PKD repeat protein
VANNVAFQYGGGIDYSTLYNCIVYFNQATNGANYSDYTTFAYSCTTPLPPGPGNIDADPQLVTASHLGPNSPCARAGNPVYATGVDVDGEPWVNPPAMGADQPGPAIGPLSLWIDASFIHVTTGYPISFTAWNTGPISSSVWDFGNGQLLTNAPFINHAWNAPGVFTVRLTGYNDSYPAGVTATLQVTVSEAVAYVDAASANPVLPYGTWATAARTIQEAVEADTLPGRLVLVTNGVYRMGTMETYSLLNLATNRVALTDVLMVRSVNGPEVTVIEGETNGVRCAYVGNGAVLSGFTLTNGMANCGGGVFCESFGVVTNCVLTGNSAASGGGACNGTLYHCLLTSNSASEVGGGADGGHLYNCILTGNSATQAGGGAWDSTLYNCTVAKNSAAGRGGGTSGGRLYNCILIGNSAMEEGGGGAYGRLYNCTLTGNSAARGGGVNKGTLYNCIVYFNQATNGANYSDYTTFAYSCTTPLPPGPGNIAADPKFMNAAASDFRLRPDSRCIDAGTNLTTLPATDLGGLPRIMDGNRDGLARVDIGTYEFNPYRFTTAFELGLTGLVFTVQGEPGKTIRLESSRDLEHWELVTTLPIPPGGQRRTDPLPLTESCRFYRTVWTP